MSSINRLDVARKELREDETRKAQALLQFREWISKHPAFKNYRTGLEKIKKQKKVQLKITCYYFTDDSFFLQFLRARKFNNLRAYELYENYFIHIRTNPHWHADDEKIINKVMKTIERGVIYPFSQRDAEGRKIVFLQLSRLDTSVDTSESIFSLNSEVYTQIQEDEDTQIAGCVSIVDFTGFTLKLLSILSIADARVMANNLSNQTPLRIKCIYILNVPSFARVLLDVFKMALSNVFKMALSDKLKKRLFVVKDLDEFKSKYFDAKLLPKELGGIYPEADMIKEFQETMKHNQKKRQQIYDTEFDVNMIPGKKTQEINVGSFRKLEID
ncbi:unnamed protein product [Diamesa tonsa]